MGELETLGFELETDYYGARLVPAAVVRAVRAARAEKRGLDTLRTDPTLRSFLKRSGRNEDVDALEALIEARGELAIMRELVGAMHQALQGLATPASYQEPSWSFLDLPDPRLGL